MARLGSHDFPCGTAPLSVKDKAVQGKPADVHNVLCLSGGSFRMGGDVCVKFLAK